ncbi:hypothetical protein GCK72_019571 [Caenorhabditis remanei]|uniref:Receptor L-domain domain-containing protein n=1 Tax=Caenorhabditis remanei TaxID=31234 RepID=A0A6A5GEA8_CAERE|nr:hypothetical protein GCK72_019571 [Caenorhabditis remanei]KAF1753015.1 hypothetical protein GCK72_019571 [Caenorhabditis remanei]
MLNLMKPDYIALNRFNRMYGSYCEIPDTSVFSQKTCDIENSTLAGLDSGCVQLRGDVKIEEGDEEYVKKLESVETIFGALIVRGTNLTNLQFLSKLKNIMSFAKEDPAVLVEFNPLLTNVSLPSFKRYLSNAHNPILFNNNSAELLKNPDHCYSVRNGVTTEMTWIAKFDGKVCEDIERVAASPAAQDKSAITCGSKFFSLLLMLILFMSKC